MAGTKGFPNQDLQVQLSFMGWTSWSPLIFNNENNGYIMNNGDYIMLVTQLKNKNKLKIIKPKKDDNKGWS